MNVHACAPARSSKTYGKLSTALPLQVVAGSACANQRSNLPAPSRLRPPASRRPRPARSRWVVMSCREAGEALGGCSGRWVRVGLVGVRVEELGLHADRGGDARALRRRQAELREQRVQLRLLAVQDLVERRLLLHALGRVSPGTLRRLLALCPAQLLPAGERALDSSIRPIVWHSIAKLRGRPSTAGCSAAAPAPGASTPLRLPSTATAACRARRPRAGTPGPG
jgi:hypothetical protein